MTTPVPPAPPLPPASEPGKMLGNAQRVPGHSRSPYTAVEAAGVTWKPRKISPRQWMLLRWLAIGSVIAALIAALVR